MPFTERYTSKELAAPMVRASTLPFREECVYYGADYVFTEEIIDKKLIASTEKMCDDGTIIFSTDKSEGKTVHFLPERRSSTVLQLGTADGVLASEAALKVIDYVSEVNVNMGCPKSFSVQGGMGAALLKKPELACDIVRTLRSSIPTEIPITCKIRYLGDLSDPPQKLLQDTCDFIRGLQNAGASAATVHMRTTPMRPRDPAVWTVFGDVIKHLPADVTIPIIANGDFFNRNKIDLFRNAMDTYLEGSSRGWCNSVMVARGCLYNPAIFLKTANSPTPEQVAINFFNRCTLLKEHKSSVKWILAQMVEGGVTEYYGEPMKVVREKIHGAKNMQELWNAVSGVQDTRIRSDLVTKKMRTSLEDQVHEDQCHLLSDHQQAPLD